MKSIKKVAALFLATATIITLIPLTCICNDNTNNAAVIPCPSDNVSGLIIAVNECMDSDAPAPGDIEIVSNRSAEEQYAEPEFAALSEPSELSRNESGTELKTFYSLTDTCEYDAERGLNSVSAACLYEGVYCKVWCQTVCDESIKMTAENAAALGMEFDRVYPIVTESFGDYIYDVDGDGKVALLCYDMGDEKTRGVGPTYMTGCFVMDDLANKYGLINNTAYMFSRFTNQSDMLHIDTYPSMGSSLESCDAVYSTVVHELQHLIAFSKTVKVKGRGFEGMPAYLSEGFSMEAERLVYGDEVNSGYVSLFNNAGNAINGESLTVFDGSTVAYGRAYVFAEYLRARWAQLNGGDGSDFFGCVTALRERNNCDTLSIICNLLETEQNALIADFWAAVLLKEEDGPHGFNGQPVADLLSFQPIETDGGAFNIGNGGGAFFIGDGASLSANENVAFYTITYDIPEIDSAALTRTGDNSARAVVTLSDFDGSARIYLGDEYIGDAVSGVNTFDIAVSELDSDYGFTLRYAGIQSNTVSAFLSGIPQEPTLVLTGLTARRYSFYGVRIKFTANETGRIYYIVSYSAIKNKNSIKNNTAITEGENDFIGSASLTTSVVSYYFKDANGNESPIYSIRI